jgi:hypothetical protein
MKKISFWMLLVLLAFVAPVTLLVSRRADPPDATSFLAYSFREAERRLRTPAGASAEVGELGGITHLVGILYDAETRDLILVGQVNPGEPPITLDDFVVALRALFIHKAWPLVSIDKTPETVRTGLQHVRFEGGIANSAFGKAVLDADVILKLLALHRLPEIAGLQSYLALSVEAAKSHAGDQERVSTRFWFHPLGASFVTREGVFVVNEFAVGVHAQVVNANGAAVGTPAGVRDEPGERFAQALTTRFAAFSDARPEVRRLKPLFDLVALAKGVQALPSRPDLGYWLREYPVPRVETPSEYALLTRQETITRPDDAHVLTIDGGIALNPLVMRLEDGDVTALRDAVLRARPKAAALTWRLPLAGWQTPGTSQWDTDIASTAQERLMPARRGGQIPGAHITRHLSAVGATAPGLPPSLLSPLAPGHGRGGVSGDVQIRGEDFMPN